MQISWRVYVRQLKLAHKFLFGKGRPSESAELMIIEKDIYSSFYWQSVLEKVLIFRLVENDLKYLYTDEIIILFVSVHQKYSKKPWAIKLIPNVVWAKCITKTY